MRNLKQITTIILFLAFVQVQGQSKPTGTISATTTNTFNYLKDGVKRPYKVKVQESRAYYAKFDEEDKGKIDQDRVSIPIKVAKLITVTGLINSSENTVISLKYEKQAADNFELISTDRGFMINVADKSMEYIIGKGVYFSDVSDENYFIIDEYDMVE